MRPILQLSLCLLLFVFASPAYALPEPMPKEELLEKSDLVAIVRVLAVICTAVVPDKDTGEDLPRYLAQMEVLAVKKGNVKKGEIVLVTWSAVPKDVVGRWTVNYYPGEEVLTHLVKNAGGATYNSTWWNAKGKDIKPPETKDLPTQPGKSVERTP